MTTASSQDRRGTRGGKEKVYRVHRVARDGRVLGPMEFKVPRGGRVWGPTVLRVLRGGKAPQVPGLRVLKASRGGKGR